MKLASFPFQTLDWTTIAKEEHQGITGTATWEIFMMNEIRVRMVAYSPVILPTTGAKKGISFFVSKAKCKPNSKMEGFLPYPKA